MVGEKYISVPKNQYEDKMRDELKIHSKQFHKVNREIRTLHGKDNFWDQMSRMFDLLREDIK